MKLVPAKPRSSAPTPDSDQTIYQLPGRTASEKIREEATISVRISASKASWFRAGRDADPKPAEKAAAATTAALDSAEVGGYAKPARLRRQPTPPRSEDEGPRSAKAAKQEQNTRTPVEVTLAKSGGKGGKTGKGRNPGLWTGTQETKVTSFFSAKGAGGSEAGKGEMPKKGSQKGLGSNRTKTRLPGVPEIQVAASPKFASRRDLLCGGWCTGGLRLRGRGDLLVSLVVDEIDVKEEHVVLKFVDDAGWEEEYCSDGYCETDVEEISGKSSQNQTRLTRSEMRGEPDSGGDQDELVAELLPDILKVQENAQSETSRSSAEEEESRTADPVETETQGPVQDSEIKEDASRAAEECGKVVAATERPVQVGTMVLRRPAQLSVLHCEQESQKLTVLLREPSTALAALRGMISLHEEVGRVGPPSAELRDVRNLPVLLDKFGSRQRDVQVAAEDAAETLIARLNPRPDSSRRGKRGSPSRRKEPVNIVHGSNEPAPIAGSVLSGPGQFRNYASDARYTESDPLRQAEPKHTSSMPYALGPASNTSSFRTLDIAKANEQRHNWTKIDTFLTPAGHSDFDSFGRSPRRGTSPSRHEASARSILAEEMWTDLSSKLDQLRVQINQDTQSLLEPLQKELDSEISKTKEMVQTVRNDNLKAFEEIRRLRSMEQHKHMLQAYPAPVEKDVLEAEFKNTNGSIQALSDAVSQIGEEISSHLKANVPSRSSSGRRMHPSMPQAPQDTKSLNKSDLDDMFQTVRDMVADIDFSELLEGVKEIIPVAAFREAFARTEARLSEMGDEIRKIHEEVQDRHVEVDFQPVLEAVTANDDLRSSTEQMLNSVKELQAQIATEFETIPSIVWARQPAIDFSPVLESIIENKVSVDFSPVLTAVNELTLQEDMSKQFAAILEEIDRKQGQIDFSEVLDEIRTTKMKVDFAPVLSNIDDAAETTCQTIAEGLKTSLNPLAESSASILEMLQEKSQDQSVKTGLAGLKDMTARLSQQFSILLQTVSEEKEAKVDFSPVLDAIADNKVHVDFTEVLAAIKKHGDTTEITDDITRLIKNVQEMKVQVDFTPVLRGLREVKVDTVFEVLNALRDQRTDIGELKDGLVRHLEEVQSHLRGLHEGLHSESKEALTSKVVEAVRSVEIKINLAEILDGQAAQKDHLDQCLQDMQERLETDIKLSLDQVRDFLGSLQQDEQQLAVKFDNIAVAVKGLQEIPQPDFSLILQAIQEKQFAFDDAAILHALEYQAVGQEQMHEELKETVTSWHRHAEALKMVIRERVDSVLKAVSASGEAADMLSLRTDVSQVLDELKRYVTKEDLEEQYSNLLRSIEAMQIQQMESQSSRMLTIDLERRVSDTMEALQEQKDSDRAVHTVVKEQMHKLRHDFLSKFQAMWDAQEKDRSSAANLLEEQMQRLKAELSGDVSAHLRMDVQKVHADLLPQLHDFQTNFLAQFKDVKVQVDHSEVLQAIQEQGKESKLESSVAQVLSAIRSQPASTDLTPVLNSIRETQELTQGLSYSLRSWRAEIASNVNAPGSSDTSDHVQPPAVSWESHEVMSDMLSDKLSHQTAAIQQFLQSIFQRLDFSAVLLAIGEQTADVKAALAEQRGQVTGKLQSLQQQLQQLQGLEPGSAAMRERPTGTGQDMDFSEVLAAIRSVRPAAGPQMDLSEVLDAIRAVPAQVDLSYEFSAVLTAIQDKQPELDLPAIRSVVSDSKQDILFQLEEVRSLIRSQAQLDPSRSPSRRQPSGKDVDFSTILTAIKDQKVSIDFSVAQVLNNIQQKQQEAIDRMEKTEKQLDHLKEGLQKLNGQELRPRSATANPAPCSPRCGRFNAQQWLQLPGAPWIPPGILGLDELNRRE
ncbi:hypothetical protein AK812_SmicGene27462 [Symbiodinium microadriaticum]|uniref:Uncharacterized protein n=1 Tax=Symbiodinium microadriaticum TaxID=2951 RepID=A0A1Q9D6Z5_SYMMI|nr:hypothetical protein AK812_SmicGene27462 [Symbiodinium microadriaticum]